MNVIGGDLTTITFTIDVHVQHILTNYLYSIYDHKENQLTSYTDTFSGFCFTYYLFLHIYFNNTAIYCNYNTSIHNNM